MTSYKAWDISGNPCKTKAIQSDVNNNITTVCRTVAFSATKMDGPAFNSSIQSNQNGQCAEAGLPGFISTKSSVFEDALEVQNRPFSAISYSDTGGGDGGGGGDYRAVYRDPIGKEGAIEKTTTMLGVISVVATAMSVLSVVLIIRFDFKQGEAGDGFVKMNGSTGWGGLVWYESLLDVGTVLSSFCVMLNLHCVVVCVSQCYFASKMLTLPHGYERSLKYLRNTSCLRYFAVSSFAVGVPIFIFALCTYLLLEFRLVAASVSSGLLILGVLMVFCSFTHSIVLWNWEKHKAARSSKPRCNVYNIDGNFGFSNHGADLNITDSNLSTMV